MYQKRNRAVTFIVAAMLVLTTGDTACAGQKKNANLADLVPEDVFLLTIETPNPERDFLRSYWAEVGEALNKSGVREDLLALVASFMNADEQEEVNRIEARLRELFQGVNWQSLGDGGMVFAERMNQLTEVTGGGLHMGPPDMVWILPGKKEAAATNFTGLTALLDGIVSEINAKIGEDTLTVTRAERHGAEVAAVDLMSSVDTAPSLQLSVARRGGLLVIALGEDILDQVLALAAGETENVAPLGKNARYRDAFEKLPKEEDGLTFFDMQALLSSVEKLSDRAFQEAAKPGDVVINSIREGTAHELSQEAWRVYEEGDFERGLELVEEAHAAAPSDSRVLYYLACFQALNGHRDQALDYLELSVAGGFYCPNHIAQDPDLEIIRSDPRYAAALELAEKLAAGQSGKKMELARAVMERSMAVPSVVDYVAAVKSTDSYSCYTDSRVELVAGAESNPFYPVISRRPYASGFDRFLPVETESFVVSGGLDPKALYAYVEDTFQAGGEEGKKLLAAWAELQESSGFDIEKDLLAWLDGDLVAVTLENGLGSVVLLKVSDESVAHEKVDAALGALTAMIEAAAEEQPMLGMLSIRRAPVLNERLKGFETLSVGMSPQPVVWGTADGHLVFASSPEAVITCLDTAAGDHAGVHKNPRVTSEWIAPKGPFTTVSLSDQRELGEGLAKMLGMVAMGVNMAGMQAQDPRARSAITSLSGILTKLAPVARKIDFIESTAALKTFDGTGWSIHQVTHFEAP
ncbi:MAG: hypothetical protein P8Y93_07355 [Acidobacteriota bacterium]